MRIDWLDDVIALIDAGSVSDAAALRHVTQPAFSRRIRALEDILGFELLDRSSKPSRPSAVLRSHEGSLRKATYDIKHIILQMRQQSRTGARKVVIASQHAISTSLGPKIVKAVADQSRTQIRLRSANLDECLSMVMSGEADLALTYRLPGAAAPFDHGLIEESHVADEVLVPVFARDQVEAMLARFRAGDLPMVGYPSDVFLGMVFGTHILPVLEQKCTITVVAETALTLAALQMSRAGAGVAWVPEALAAHDIATGVLSDLRDEMGMVPMQLIASRILGAQNLLAETIWPVLQDLSGALVA